MTAAEDEGPQPEQSMDDILASIRRIMLDEQARLKDAGVGDGAGVSSFVLPAVPAEAVGESESVLVLDDSMVVQPAAAPAATLFAPDPVDVVAHESAIDHALPVERDTEDRAEQTVGSETAATPLITGLTAQAIEDMLAPAAAAAAAASVDALLRRLAEERQALLQPVSSSPTMEEFVRAELRPLLKSWLDENLPAIVERLVRAELARLTLRHGV
jgi:cell pole-organizing protein PopZ